MDIVELIKPPLILDHTCIIDVNKRLIESPKRNKLQGVGVGGGFTDFEFPYLVI